MFNFKKKKQNQIFAAMNGEIVDIEKVPDEAFAQKMLGDGVAISPSDGNVYSPVDGVVEDVTQTLHAYCIRSDDGLDVLIHVGINTVELKGEGFDVKVKAGDTVKKGDLLAKADLSLIKEKGYETYTPILITNMHVIKDINCKTGSAKATETEVISYSLA